MIDGLIDEKELDQILSTFKSQEEVDVFLKALEELVKDGASGIESDLRGIDYIETPVDMETFMRDPYYLGIIDSVYPRLVDDLLELFAPGNEYYLIVMGGSIGWGKSTFAEIAMARILYEVSTMQNPHKAYGIMESDKLFFVNVSVTHTQAKRVIFDGLKGKIKNSDYFRSNFPYEDMATELRFPRNILLAAATQAQVLGMNTFAAAMDEANFMTITEGSAAAKVRGKRVFDQAEVVFSALIRRMETRFLKRGMLPGKLFALSSAQYPDDFIERKLELYKGSNHAFCRTYAVWDTHPSESYLGPKFRVFFSRESGMGRIGVKADKPNDDEDTIEVPIEYKHDFEVDMEGALRDLAGKATVAIEPFIMRREKIMEMCDPNRRHPYSLYETSLRDGGYILKDVLCEWVPETTNKETGAVIQGHWQPKINPKTKRFIHIDPAISGDAAGFVMGHVSHYELRQRIRVVQVIDPASGMKKIIREPFSENLPVIWIDLILRIVPPPGGEIILNDVRLLIYELRSLRFKIGLITMDTYQSKDTQQLLEAKKFKVEELSVDANIEPYNRTKMALYENRVVAYTHDVLIAELKGLERNKKKGKIDHRPKGSKDVADGLAGVIFDCETRRVPDPVELSLGELGESEGEKQLKREQEELKWLLES